MNGHARALAVLIPIAAAMLLLVLGLRFYFVDSATSDLDSARVEFCRGLETVKAIQLADVNHRLANTNIQINRSYSYLREHPDGGPEIPRRLIVQGIFSMKKDRADLRKTRGKLAPHHC